MMRVRSLAALVICLLLSVPVALARDYYVDAKTGDDGNSGASPSEAWKTLGHAVEAVTGDEYDPAVIHLGDGGYHFLTEMDEEYGFRQQQLPAWVWLSGNGPFKTSISTVLLTLGCKTIIENLEVRVIQNWPPDPLADSQVFVRNCILHGLRLESYGLPDGTVKGLARVFLSVSNCYFHRYMSWSGNSPIYLASGSFYLQVAVQNSTFSRIHCAGLKPYTACVSQWITLRSGYDPFWLVGSDRLTVDNCAFIGTGYCKEQIDIYLSAEKNWRTEAHLSNCFFRFSDSDPTWYSSTGGSIPERCIWLETSENGECSVDLVNCSVVGDVALASEGVGGTSQHVRMLDSILWTKEENLFLGAAPVIRATNSTLSFAAGGDGLIHSDPLFVSGGLGDLYLSQQSAGQARTSPCVDAGSVLASESTVSGLTTRTDHTPDAGMLDMGFHYGTRIGPKPYIELGHDGGPLPVGTEATIYVLLKKEGVIMLADAYLAAASGNQMAFFSAQGWTNNQLPWMERVPLCFDAYNEPREGNYYSFPLLIPESAPLGTYKLYLGLVDHYSGELVSLASTDLQVVAEPSF